MKTAKELYENEFAEVCEWLYSWDERTKREMPFYKKNFKQVKPNKILDIGSAAGLHLCLFKQIDSKLKIWGLDISNKYLNKARKNLEKKGFTDANLIQLDLTDIVNVSINEIFDIINCSYTLSALNSEPKIIELLTWARKHLSKNGRLIIEDRNGQNLGKDNLTHYKQHLEKNEYELFNKCKLQVSVNSNLNKRVTLEIKSGNLLINIRSQFLYKLMQKKQIGVSIFNRCSNHLTNDYVIIQNYLFSNKSIKHYRTQGILLDQKKIKSLLKKSGFTNINIYGSHNMSPMSNNDTFILVVAS